MCHLYKTMPEETHVGYKVVAVRKEDGKLFSLAMGFDYQTNQGKDGYSRVPVITNQRRLAYFANDILYYNKQDHMTGRTALFVEEKAAKRLKAVVDYTLRPHHYPDYVNEQFAEYEVAVYRCEIRNECLGGTYENDEVIAGREVRFVEKVY